MSLTPRQMFAFLDFSNVERASQLMIDSIAAQGDGKLIEKTLKDLYDRAVQGQHPRSMAADDS